MKDWDSIVLEQKEICRKYQADFLQSPIESKMGVSLNVKQNVLPINGLRVYPENGTSGWYIWAGEELSKDPDFFQPLHVEHIGEWVSGVEKYLGLAPGWRFLIAGDYIDVWFDQEILVNI
jgi:hypothetical protein